MRNIIDSICFFVFLIGTGAVWFVLPTLIVFGSLYRLKKKMWRFPCNLFDVLTIFSVCIIWVYFSGKDSMGRGLGWFVDLIVIGFVYGILFALRTLFIYKNIRYRMMASIVTLVLTDIIMLFFVLTGIIGKE
jgi:hypothetical protein